MFAVGTRFAKISAPTVEVRYVVRILLSSLLKILMESTGVR